MTALLPEGYHDRLPPYADAAASVEARVLDMFPHTSHYEVIVLLKRTVAEDAA